MLFDKLFERIENLGSKTRFETVGLESHETKGHDEERIKR